MGILKSVGKKIGKSVIKVGASFAAIETINKLEKKVRENKKKKIDLFLEDRKENHKKYILIQDKTKVNETYKILNQNGIIKYLVKGNFFSIKHDLSLYDYTGNKKIGGVKEQLISIRLPISFEKNPKDYNLFLGNKFVGKIKSRYSVSKHKYICSFNKNWRIVGNMSGSCYKLYENEVVLMELKKQIAIHEDIYFIDVLDVDNELICILIALAIDCSLSSKFEDNDNAIIRKII